MTISNSVARSFNILEYLATHHTSLGVTEISEALLLPKSTTHRLLNDLQLLGYVNFNENSKTYYLSFKLSQLGFKSLASHSIYEAAQPILNQLAALSNELVRLSFSQNGKLVFLAKAQGSSLGLKVDADMGNEAYLGYSASGMAWLSSFENTKAWEIMQSQIISFPQIELSDCFIHNKAYFFEYLDAVRSQKYSILHNTMGIGTTAIASPILNKQNPEKGAIAVISIAGPTLRFTEEKCQSLSAKLIEQTNNLSLISLINQ